MSMYEHLLATLNAWNSTKSERVKLQHTYLFLTLAIILASGIISLFKARDGHDAVKFALAAIIIYFTNAIVWSLLNSSVLSKLSSRPSKR
jgi:hypothetical protein